MGLILGLIAAFFVGAAMVELGITDPDFELGSRIFSIICGIIMMVPGLCMLPPLWREYRKKRKAEGKKGGLFRFLAFQRKEPITEEQSEREQRISSFRNSYREFFGAKTLEENAALQNDVTQVHWNILALQKRRLEQKNVRMEFDSKRMRFGSYPDYEEKGYSDGKYQICDVVETLDAKKVFLAGERVIGKDKCTQLAGITLLDAKQSGKGKLVCPNCGNSATRENLIDGCDYCGTKFTVEDLSERVSSFAFLSDYDLTYEKYKDVRSRFSLIVGLIVGIPTAIFSLIGAIGAILGGAAEGSGPFMMFCSILLTIGFVTFAAVYLSLCFFYFFLFPWIQATASTVYFARKNLDELKKAKEKNSEMEELIRKEDPLFSINGFYSGIQNKLATIFYGATDEEMLAFTEGEEAEKSVLSMKNRVKDVVNVTTNWMRIASYGVEDGVGRMIVEGYLTLTRVYGKRLRRENVHVRFQVTRDADCKTKAVTGPTFSKCPGCGNAMSLLSGKTCSYCGRVRVMSALDWAITNIKLYNN